MIADMSRGANLEFLLTLIRMRRRDGLKPKSDNVFGQATVGSENVPAGPLRPRVKQ
jgi:hypothetical protein